MASVLLSALYAEVICPAQIQDGFYILLAFLVLLMTVKWTYWMQANKALPESSKGVQVIQTAEKNYISAPHHAELVERRWSGSTHVTVEKVKKKICGLLREYVEIGDTLEACRCIRELRVPFYHHEVVKRALILGMETQTAEPLITKLQMAKGFSHLADSLDDLALDIPSAKTLFQSLVPKAIFEGWLDDSFVESLSADGEVQVGDEKVRQFEKEIVSIIHEYFLSDDIPELIESLEDLAAPEYNPIFLKKLITLAMDGKSGEKEMASVLLSALHTEIFSAEDKVNGFVLLLESAEDTELDNLDASNELALFSARAVIDDVLAPLNLEEIGSRLRPNCSATETVRMAQSLVSARHAGERLLGGSH
ncbi:putative initiation factor eIF-4 gamma, MA3 [Rosa chinensis]|uniref:Putative initiation factor eIF-4 gamma, MA3 n=1 Tax=Rosa chinensis TaxID=74649 RepID=A0A2P6P5D4_ROSCH|nr:putative initiation factor eIF-4 gamma, MA3 [Rosa chinensis]